MCKFAKETPKRISTYIHIYLFKGAIYVKDHSFDRAFLLRECSGAARGIPARAVQTVLVPYSLRS